MSAQRPLLALGAALLLLTGCGASFVDTLAAERSAAAEQPAATPAERACGQRAEPDPDRPVVELDLRLDDDLRTVTGTETVVFTPDLTTDELVFRLVPNGPGPAAAGNRLVVDPLEERFGPFPYATLTVPLLPNEGGGIEYTSSFLLAGADRGVVPREVAHKVV